LLRRIASEGVRRSFMSMPPVNEAQHHNYDNGFAFHDIYLSFNDTPIRP
jgi:hypothetical protein